MTGRPCGTIAALAVTAAIALAGCAEPARSRLALPPSSYGPADAPGGLDAATETPRALGGAERRQPILVRGSGRFIDENPAAAPSAQRATQAAVNADGGTILNFSQVDIREVVENILGTVLSRNYLIDPEVQGEVTLRTSRPIPRQDLLPLLETVLRVKGAALVDTGGVIQIVPVATAPRIAAGRGREEEGFALRIVPLRYVSAADLQRSLAPFAEGGEIIRVDDARNLLILAGPSATLDSLSTLIEIFDADILSGMSFGLFPLERAEADAVAAELSVIFGAEGERPLADVLRFQPIDRLNAVLVISQQPDYLARAGAWIERLDQGADDTAQLFIYRLQNAKASEVSEVLGQVYGIGITTTGRADLAVGPGLRPATLTLSETPDTGGVLTGPVPPDTVPPDIRGGAGDRGGGRGETLRIIADEANNAVVIHATPPQYRGIESALRSLDVKPLQVMIEATVAEVTLTDELRYGLQWFFQSGDVSGGFSTGNSALPVQQFPGFSLLAAGSDIRAVLNALEGITDVNVVSSPHLMVLNNQTALLQVGDQVPVPVQQAVGLDSADAVLINTIQFRDTGIILRVTPRVNAGGLVTLTIEQEVSDVAQTTTSGIDAPTIQQRRILSTVAVNSGDTLALGGLIRNRQASSRSGLPLLSRLPVMGGLFGTTDRNASRTELLVLVTPRVVASRTDARMVTDELRRKLQGLILTPPSGAPAAAADPVPAS